MDATDLHARFRIGDWLVEPAPGRLSGPSGVRQLPERPLQLLLCLAERHGEVVDRRVLRARLWPDGQGSDEQLRECVAELRALLGDAPRSPRYIASVAQQGYALIAHYEPLPASGTSASPEDAAAVVSHPPTLFGRMQRLVSELRRRQVFKVAGAYLVSVWIVLQVAEVTFQPLHLPEWWMTALTILAVIGFPIVLVLAWSYEITAGGIVLDPGAAGGSLPETPRARRAMATAVVAGVAAMASVTGVAWWKSIQTSQPIEDRRPPPEPGVPSVAVLPFVDMSPAGGNAYLAEGLSEELSMRLAQVPGLRVAARTSAFEFKDRSIDVRQIGAALGVRNVLEGSVRRDGQSVRVTAQLIDTSSGYHLWAGNFDRRWSDVLALQDDIAQAVTDALRVVLAPKGSGAPRPRADALAERAIDPYLAGLAMLRGPSDLSRLDEAEARFDEVKAIAPAFAGAYAGLCEVAVRRYERTRDPTHLASAEHACRDALDRDASLLDTRRALARLYLSAGEFERAADAYRRLLEHNPQDADAYVGIGSALAGLGRDDDAEASFRRAIAVDPGYSEGYARLGSHLFRHGRAAEATAALRKVTELFPASATAWSNLGGALQISGDFAGAAQAFRRSLQLEPSKDAYSNLATSEYFGGHYEQAMRLYESALAMAEHDQVVWGNLGDVLWQMAGQRDAAVAKYRRAAALGEEELAKTPGDATLRAQLGYYYGRIGESSRSLEYLERARAEGGDQLYVRYYLAVAAVDRGEKPAAIEGVRALLRLGYPAAMLRSAPEFRALRGDPEYKKAVGES